MKRIPVLLLGAVAGCIGDAGRWILATADSARALPWASPNLIFSEGPAWLARSLPALVGIGMAWSAFAISGWKRRILLLLASLTLTFTGSASLAGHGILWDPFPCALAALFGWIAGLILAGTMTSNVSDIARLFGGRMSDDRLKHWLTISPEPDLRCQNRPATVLTVHFLDEARTLHDIGPSAFLHITDELARLALSIGLRHGALHENSPRDLVRLVFGLPEPEPNDTRAAIAAALEIQAALAKSLNARHPRLALGFGIGLASGTLACGAVSQRYHLVGKPIETSRLLSLSGSQWGTTLLADSETVEQAGQPLLSRPVGFASMPNEVDVESHEILTIEEPADPSVVARNNSFCAAIAALRMGDAATALSAFRDARNAGDGLDPVLEQFLATTEALVGTEQVLSVKADSTDEAKEEDAPPPWPPSSGDSPVRLAHNEPQVPVS